MRHLVVLIIHLIAILVQLLEPGGGNEVLATRLVIASSGAMLIVGHEAPF
jgi:hypothetical protein